MDNNSLKNACPVGKHLADEDLGSLKAKVVTLETKIDALETKLAAVLAATASDSGKTLKIDSAGKVALTS